jgi:hypothetical protein
MDLNPHTYSHIMSMNDHHVIMYLTIFFVTTSSWVQDFIFQLPLYPFVTQISVIYIMTVRIIVGTELLSISFLLYPSLIDHCATLSLFSIIHNRGFAGSQKFPNSNFSCPPPPPSSCFSQHTFKYVLMLIIYHVGSVKIVINKRRA